VRSCAAPVLCPVGQPRASYANVWVL